MKLTKTQLKRIIKEELGRVLAEEGGLGFEFEGTETKIEFLGMEIKHSDQFANETEIKLRVNGEVGIFTVAEDPATVGALADEIIQDPDMETRYWFLDGNSPDLVSVFKAKLEETLKAIGADPEAEDDKGFLKHY